MGTWMSSNGSDDGFYSFDLTTQHFCKPIFFHYYLASLIARYCKHCDKDSRYLQPIDHYPDHVIPLQANHDLRSDLQSSER